MRAPRFRSALAVLVALTSASVVHAGDLVKQANALDRVQLGSVVRFLSHDLLEGRAPGTRGGELAEEYVQSMFEWMGLTPGWQGSFQQPFAMKGTTTTSLALQVGDATFTWPEEVVGGTSRSGPDFVVEGDAVFAGFGISSEAFDWDDFKGEDVRGKFLVVRVNDPGSEDPALFEGASMTYFGRWRYKIEAAHAAGARGIVMIHTDRSAGYGWNVVRNSWTGEELFLPGSAHDEVEFSGWIREEPFRRVLAAKGIDLDRLYAASLRRDFRPVQLGFAIRAVGKNTFREVRARNVVGEIPGSTPERIVLIAHLDHFGVKPNLEGDQIMNGAIDNGSAVAALLLTARVLSENRGTLRHTVTVIACNAEEAGLLGSTYYVANTDRGSIVAAINFESSPVWEASGSVMGVGARYSTLEDMLQEVARDAGVKYSEFSMRDQGFFFRSDQFPFAHAGIPALWISAGEDFVSGRNRLREFFAGDYHTPRDQFDPSWSLDSLRQTVSYALGLVEKIDRSPERPRWKTRLTFPVER